MTVITKGSSAKSGNQPAKNIVTTNYAAGKSQRKIAKSIANTTTKQDYRPDLTRSALARASAILRSQRASTGKTTRERKPRGKKAQA